MVRLKLVLPVGGFDLTAPIGNLQWLHYRYFNHGRVYVHEMHSDLFG